MNIDLEIKYSSHKYSWLCFKHAVQLANQGIDIDVELGDFHSDYYMGSTICSLCVESHENKRQELLDNFEYPFICEKCGKRFKSNKSEYHTIWKGNIPEHCGEIHSIK